MATMVARGNSLLSTSGPIQEKGSRNKRKFRADPPVTEPDKLVVSQPSCPNRDLPPVDTTPYNPNLEHIPSMCDICRTLANDQRNDEAVLDEFQDAGWAASTEVQLQEIVLSNLDMIFRNSIKKITAYGYTEDVAANAVLRNGAYYGCKDTISNIVDNALVYLASGQEVDTSPRENLAEDLQRLEKKVLAEMVNVLREVRPFLSTGDAMWCLLVCDMNVPHACAMDADPLATLGNDDVPSDPPTIHLKPESDSNSLASPTFPDLNVSLPNPVASNPHSLLQTELPPVIGIPNLPRGKFSASNIGNITHSSLNPSKETVMTSSYRFLDESSSLTISQSIISETKAGGSKKGSGGGSKRETILRQKSFHFEKSYRAHGSRSSIRAGKLSSLSGLILDKKCKSTADPNSVGLTASFKATKSVGSGKIQTDTSLNLSFSAASSTSSSLSSKICGSSPLAAANTELSLSLPSNPNLPASPRPNYSCTEASNCYAAIPFDRNSQWAPQDETDEMMLKLISRAKELQAQSQEWLDWGKQKVMQVTCRLTKDKAELQNLRQEKEEVFRMKKEKQTLEDNTMKKLHEMEVALSKASGQVERANTAMRRLEIENAELRQEMEAAKIQAEESAASCQEVSTREMETLKKFQSWEKQKALFQVELLTEKRKLSQIKEQLEQAKELLDQIEWRWKQEENLKEAALMQAESERKEREQIEVSAKSKEDSIRSKAEAELQIQKDDIRGLEHEIAKLRLTMGPSKIVNLRWGLDSKARSILETMDSQDAGADEVQRDRECVMCLTEEMSVVFLPCSHQVICANCNELHQKQGMKDCPWCRTPIQRRICVRSVD